MKKHLLIVTPILMVALSLLPEKLFFVVKADTSIHEVLEKLGDNSLKHTVNWNIEGVSVAKGEQLVHTGFTLNTKGKSVKKQSAHFVCTSCHNVVRDEPNLALIDVDAKLDYAAANNIPFLQGTALYGAVNRTSFYNGDYFLKYGDLVRPARHNIREAIQLCATECAQGRPLEDWELESILAYLWTIDLKVHDLQLTEVERQIIEETFDTNRNKENAIKLLKSKYLSGAPATFQKPPKDREEGYTATGNAENGKHVYELSCKHCHAEERYSFFNLDDSQHTFDFLAKHIAGYTQYSIYQVSRYGTSPVPGKRAYMPHYTKEKMSNQQLEDLRAYIESMAK
ncbi:MAG: c-type cytochrome [Bacteroidota bacterium]